MLFFRLMIVEPTNLDAFSVQAKIWTWNASEDNTALRKPSKGIFKSIDSGSHRTLLKELSDPKRRLDDTRTNLVCWDFHDPLGNY